MDIAEDAVAFMKSVGLTLATVESCTGGLIAAKLAAVPGSGTCLDVGFVTYSPSGKAGFLGVREQTIETFGLTSEEVAREMAEGALDVQGCAADVAVSNTGVADGGGDGGPPPGTQCFAWSWQLKEGERVTFSETARFAGSRNEVREAAAMYALSRIEHYYRLLPLDDVDDEI
ncbi:nicotinamide-nucleotide amidohydrolase family protein [Paraburkholderia sp. J41]|uniref:CinA family protein n=1 Tax=Paraburkholderia sp. J41 TaxID=2805433 RepID=UPI002AC36E72|nr:nicotinamide-nucleotide amidohydrolase family protein [Paraburkholderia sp. J41]